MGVIMRKKIFIWLTSLITFISLSLIGLMIFVLLKMNIGDLLVCSLEDRKSLITNEVCEYYLVNHRITDEDIQYLSKGPGLNFIMNINNERKFKISEMFLEKGLDIDGVNNLLSTKITALHGAILINDIDAVNFLISNGANPHINIDNMTALELAEKINKQQDRNEIIKILSAIKST